jgi:hypothetical protein
MVRKILKKLYKEYKIERINVTGIFYGYSMEASGKINKARLNISEIEYKGEIIEDHISICNKASKDVLKANKCGNIYNDKNNMLKNPELLAYANKNMHANMKGIKISIKGNVYVYKKYDKKSNKKIKDYSINNISDIKIIE